MKYVSVELRDLTLVTVMIILFLILISYYYQRHVNTATSVIGSAYLYSNCKICPFKNYSINYRTFIHSSHCYIRIL